MTTARLAAGPASALPRAGCRCSSALAFGTAVALPQLVELLRILPTSTRGVRGYDATASTIGSWDPRQAIEQLLPLPFGRVDRAGPGGFWGQRFHTGMLPLFITLYPGLLPLALAAAAGRARGRGGAFAWTALGLGLFVALGRFNPLVAALAALPARRRRALSRQSLAARGPRSVHARRRGVAACDRRGRSAPVAAAAGDPPRPRRRAPRRRDRRLRRPRAAAGVDGKRAAPRGAALARRRRGAALGAHAGGTCRARAARSPPCWKDARASRRRRRLQRAPPAPR